MLNVDSIQPESSQGSAHSGVASESLAQRLARTREELQHARGDISAARAVMAWVLDNKWTPGMSRSAMTDDEAVEWLAAAMGAEPRQLALELGVACGAEAPARPLALDLAVLLHRVVATLRRAQREPRAARAVPRINAMMPPNSQPLLSRLSARLRR